MTPELAATLQAQSATSEIPLACTITWISYAGDEGGIVCRLDFDEETEEAAFASITHLRFDPHYRWRATSRPTRSIASSDCAASRDSPRLVRRTSSPIPTCSHRDAYLHPDMGPWLLSSRC